MSAITDAPANAPATPAPPRVRGSLLKGFAAAAVAPALVNLCFFFLASAGRVPLRVPNRGDTSQLVPLGWPAIVLSCVVAAAAATGVWALLRRRGKRGQSLFLALSVVLLGLSLIPTFTMPAIAPTRMVLTAMHLVAAGGITMALIRYAPPSRGAAAR